MALIDLAAQAAPFFLLAAAMGLDPFLACVALAMAPFFGWTSFLDSATATALLHPFVIGSAAFLYGLEVVAERSQPTFVAWHSLHLVGRPLAAGLLASLVLPVQGGQRPLVILGFVTVAVLFHLLKVGATAMGWWLEPRPRQWLLSLVEDSLVLVLVALAHQMGGPMAAVGPLVLLLLALGGLPLLRAARFAFYLTWSRTWGSLHPFEWRPAEDLPAGAAIQLNDVPGSRHRPVRAARAAALRVVGPFRFGWLAVGPSVPAWLGGTGRPFMIAPDAVRAVIPSGLYTRVFVERSDGRSAILVLPKAGPSAGTLAAELDASATLTAPEPW